jgi:hypothetical protein
MTRPLFRLSDPAPVRAEEVILGASVPFTLAPGNPLRAAPCLVCGQAAGPGRVVAHSFLGFADPPCDCGNLTPAAFLRHCSCPPGSDRRLARMAVDRILSRHPHSGRECQR